MKFVVPNTDLVIDVPPTVNPFGEDYKYYQVEKETKKAYLVKIPIYNKFTCKVIFLWVAKSLCKVDENGDVFIPVNVTWDISY